MCKLQGIDFGYADSEKELLEMPELFDSAFVDPNNYLHELMYESRFLILGRKGSGKTAYGAKIRREAQKSESLIAHSCSLWDLDYSRFEGLAEQNVRGGRRFLNMWKYLLFLEIVKMIDGSFPNNQNEEYTQFVSLMKECGLLSSERLTRIAREIDKSSISLKFAKIIELHREIQKEKIPLDIDRVTDIGLDIVKKTGFGDTHFYLIIDGLDDSLRGESFPSDIITGLIRAADTMNRSLYYSGTNIKTIILLRTDIFAMCRDPDMAKIKRDSTINLNWTKDDLKEIVFLRIKTKYPNLSFFSDFWKNYAPINYKSKPSEQILFELTLMRPRDILQFFIECKSLYGEKASLSYTDFASAIAGYSNDYFVLEMQDELTGRLADSIVTSIPMLLSLLDSRAFYADELEEKIKQESIDITAQELLKLLFSTGYVGQLRKIQRTGGTRTRLSFSHINQHDKFRVKDECILHRGLVKAVNLS